MTDKLEPFFVAKDRNQPAKISTVTSWRTVSIGTSHVTAIRSDGLLFAWGLNNAGQLGDGTTIYRSTITQIGSSSWTAISAGNSYTTAVRQDGILFAWGINNLGQLGDGTTISKSSPVQIGSSSWTAVSANEVAHTLAIRSDGMLFAWGLNNSGQLSTISEVKSWTQVAAGVSHAVAIRNDGLLYAWGLNNVGQLGDLSTINRSSPVQIGQNSWTQVTAGASFTSAIRSDGMLFTWGLGSSGQLGFVSQITSWIAVANGSSHTVAIRNDGMLYAWGLNSSGQLGDGTTINKSSPIQIGSSSWTAVGTGFFHTLAIRSDGLLFTWGLGTSGQLGDGTAVTKSSPVQIGSSSWTAVVGGGTHAAAIRSDGLLFTWGLGTSGQLGDGTVTTKSSPVQIGSSSWTAIRAGNLHTAGLMSNQYLFAWGANNVGQVGDGSTFNRSSPVLLGYDTTNTGIVSVRFDNGSYLSIDSANNQLEFQARDFTVECYFYILSNSDLDGSNERTATIVSDIQTSPSNGFVLSVSGNSTVTGTGFYVQSVFNSSSSILTFNTSVSQQTWHHVAVVRQNGNTSLFFNGTSLGSQVFTSQQIFGSTQAIWVGRSARTSFNRNLIGYISNLRVTGNTALYTTTFTPSTTPLTLTSQGATAANVRMLVCNRLTFTDVALNATITPTTNPIIAPDNPFNVSPTSYANLAMGTSHTGVVNSSGKLFTWGHNGFGQLGDGTTVNKSIATAVGNDNWQGLFGSANADGFVAVKNDGSGWAWGLNTSGQVGDGTTVAKTSPVAIGGAFYFASLGGGHTSLIEANSVMSVHGLNNVGQLGINSVANRSTAIILGGFVITNNQSTPMQIGTSSWTAISAGTSHMAAVTASGTLFTWGLNANGQLGDGTTVNKSSPVQIGSSSWTAVAAGGSHTVALRSGGTLFAWGFNSTGQLGDATTINKSSPVVLASNPVTYNTSSWTAIGAGFSHTVAIRSGGTIFTWGLGTSGQLGDGTAGSKSSPTQIGSSSWTAVSAGGNYTAAIRSGGTLFTWGLNSSSQLGNTNYTNSSSPVQIGTASWNQVSANDTSTFALDNLNLLYSWGAGSVGQLGFNNTANRQEPEIIGGHYISGNFSSPVQIGYSSWSAISAGTAHNLALSITGNLFAWGSGVNGELGVPAIDSSQTRWSDIRVGYDHVLAIQYSTGKLYAWGKNNGGQLGDGTTVDRPYPVKISDGSWSAISAGTRYSAGIRSGTLFSWGVNGFGQLGDGTTIAKSSPTQIGSSQWAAVSTGSYHTAAIRSGGTLFTWGYNNVGQIGDSTVVDKSSPVQIGSSSWIAVGVGGSFTSAIRSGNTLFSWGEARIGQLGDSTTINKSSPVQIGSSSWTAISAGYEHAVGTVFVNPNNYLYVWGRVSEGQLGITYGMTIQSWTSISSGDSHTVAIRSDGLLFAWGLNGSGQLGDGTVVAKSSPIQIGSSSWTAVACEGNFTAAIRSGGTLFTWGLNSSGQLGDGSAVNRSSPVVLASTPVAYNTSSWTAVSVGLAHTFALRSDNMLFAWGLNSTGQLGDGTTVNKSAPVQIGSSSWTAVAGGGSHSVAIYGDNKIYTWGLNSSGQLGDASTVNKSSPVLISDSLWTQISAGASHTAAIRSGGTLFTWGINSIGQLGDGTTINRSSPVQIGTKSWTAISTGTNYSMAIDDTNKLFGWGLNNVGQIGTGGYVETTFQYDEGLNAAEYTQNWNNSTTQYMDNFGFLGSGTAHGYVPTTIFSLNLRELPSHNQIRYRVYWHFVDGSDAETNYLEIDSQRYLTFTKAAATNGVTISVNNLEKATWRGTGTNLGYSYAPETTVSAAHGYLEIDTGWISHTRDEIKVDHSFGLNEAITNEACYLSHVILEARIDTTVGMTLLSYTTPVPIGTSDWTKVSAGGSHTAAISNNLLYTWGLTNLGQLGLGTTLWNRNSPVLLGSTANVSLVNSPVLVGSAGNYTKIAAGVFQTAATYNGNVLVTGKNTFGQLGTGDTQDRFTFTSLFPKQYEVYDYQRTFSADASPLDDAQFAQGWDSVTQLPYGWGENEFGSIGDSTTIDRLSPVVIGTGGASSSIPVQIPGTWANIAAGDRFSVATNSDKLLFTWGLNNFGQLGNNSTVSRVSPVQVGNDSWTVIAAGRGIAAAIKTNETLWTWGLNNRGQLGDGTTTNKSNPAQVGNSTWSSIALGGNSFVSYGLS